MSRLSPGEMAKSVGEGLLAFPVTHFDNGFEFNEKPYREHIVWMLEHKPAAIFAAGGTGEFFSLTMQEFSAATMSTRSLA
jgi:5-dehydro-4-deoxyglucarate dehydratase